MSAMLKRHLISMGLGNQRQIMSSVPFHVLNCGYLFFIQDESEAELDGFPVGLLTVTCDQHTSPVHYNPVRISVIIESEPVASHTRLSDAFLVIFGLMYALHLSYPKALTNTFEFTQKILLGLDNGRLSPRLQTLKNDLMMQKLL